MKHTPPVKMPVAPEHQCQLVLVNGRKCTNLAWSVMTRKDATILRLCQGHSRRMREQINRYPDRFDQVRFSLIVK